MFEMTNRFDVYLHDTPSKDLFSREDRRISHGCIRVSEPQKLAEWILRKDENWNTEKIKKAMNGSKEQFVTVKQQVPVFIGYFTAWVDDKGLVNFREDVYGHDKNLSSHLFTK